MIEEEPDPLLYECRDTLKRTLADYLGKYNVDSIRVIPMNVRDSLAQLSCKEVCHLSKKTLSSLRWRLDKVAGLLDPAHFLENTLSKIKTTLDHFQEVEYDVDLLTVTLPLSLAGGAGGDLEVAEIEYLDIRREELRRRCDFLLAHLTLLFGSHLIFWETVGFSKDSIPDAEKEELKVAASNDRVSRHIDELTRFIQPCLFEAIHDDFIRYAQVISYMLQNYNQWNPPMWESTEDPIRPVLKLSRAFINKISRRTNHDVVLFGRMKSKKDILLLQKTALEIPRWVQSLATQIQIRSDPPQHENVVNALARVIATFSKCSVIVHASLLLPPRDPDVDPKLVQAAIKWFHMWHQQLNLALQNISSLIGCDFPTLEYCQTVSWDP